MYPFLLSERKKDLRLIEKQTFGLQHQTPICQQFKSLHFYLYLCSAIFIDLFMSVLSLSFARLYVCLLAFCLFPFLLFDCLSVCFPFSFSVCLPVCFPVYLFVFPINYLSVLMFFCCLSVYVHCLCSMITILN